MKNVMIVIAIRKHSVGKKHEHTHTQKTNIKQNGELREYKKPFIQIKNSHHTLIMYAFVTTKNEKL